MSFGKWADSRVRKYGWFDIWLVKITVAAGTLMIVRLWPPLISLEWYWYALIFVIAAFIPTTKFLSN